MVEKRAVTGSAERAGARVVPVAEKGYGSALMGGFLAAHGEFAGLLDEGHALVAEPDEFGAQLVPLA